MCGLPQFFRAMLCRLVCRDDPVHLIGGHVGFATFHGKSIYLLQNIVIDAIASVAFQLSLVEPHWSVRQDYPGCRHVNAREPLTGFSTLLLLYSASLPDSQQCHHKTRVVNKLPFCFFLTGSAVVDSISVLSYTTPCEPLTGLQALQSNTGWHDD